MNDRKLLQTTKLGEERDLAPTSRTKSSVEGNKLKKKNLSNGRWKMWKHCTDC